ncbi:aminoglycoside phosphotransferase family protein [Sporosarcina sp. ACRSL]|uniref:phosphotransferase n=1 Tax=Sporosarcina sp. ACRSL TaxID=2918215 RepID=UPI001EF579A5|nr:phosphotransferase [Sporosarcina sp. ACRSL]MCG7344915.1 aminoglycoside phosphotransferase family protein [Sporosarcina sp. ACRSL]
MDLDFLFEEDVKEIQELSPGYEDHASDVWLVKTEKQEVVVRTSRLTEEPNNDFWWGCKTIFGIDPRRVFELENINNTLSTITSMPVPRVLTKGKRHSREFIVVEKLTGEVVQSFVNQSSSVLQSLGEGLAKIHTYRKNYVGSPSVLFTIKLEDFHQHLNESMTELVSRFYKEEKDIKDKLDEIRSLLKDIPSPDYSSFVLVDMDPTQFLSDGDVITGLVDTEAYVVAPREFDFIGLEYVLDEKAAIDFKIGYEKVLEVPDLSQVRTPYRYLYRLLSVQGDVDITEWLNHKKLF